MRFVSPKPLFHFWINEPYLIFGLTNLRNIEPYSFSENEPSDNEPRNNEPHPYKQHNSVIIWPRYIYIRLIYNANRNFYCNDLMYFSCINKHSNIFHCDSFLRSI